MKLRELLDDLFDYRVATPEKLPKRIKYNSTEFCFKDNSYYSVVNDANIMSFVDHTLDLRCQVEIIEDKPKKIDGLYKMNINDECLCKNTKGYEELVELLDSNFRTIADYYNRFYDKLNYLLEKSDKE